MLRDGHFIKEDPPKIGAHYVPQFYVKPATPEERFAQDVLLGPPTRSWRLLEVALASGRRCIGSVLSL